MQEKKILNTFKSRLFPIKNVDKIPSLEPIPEPEPEVATESKEIKAKTKRKISPLKLREEFLNKVKNEGKNENEQIFKE